MKVFDAKTQRWQRAQRKNEQEEQRQSESLQCSDITGSSGDFLEGREETFDVLVGCEVAGAEAEGAGGGRAEGGMHAGGAVEAGAGLDGPLGVEKGGELLRVVAGEIEADDRDAIDGGARAVELDVLDFGEAGEERGELVGCARLLALDADFVEMAEGGFEADDGGDGEVAGFVTIGKRIGLAVLRAARSGAALAMGEEVRFDFWRDVEEAGAERAEEAFVAGGGEEVAADGFDIDGNVAEGLGGIDEIEDVAFFGDLADGGDGLDGTGDVGGVEERDEAGLGRDGAADIVRIDEAFSAGGGVGRGDVAVLGEELEGAEDGVVLA